MKKVLEKAIKGLDKKVEAVLASEGSKSQKMKDLFDLGLDIKEIAELMEVRYNFVYNVISNYTLVNEIEVEANVRGQKREQILELYKEGKTKKEIVIITKCNYNYVYKVTKEYDKQNKAIAINE